MEYGQKSRGIAYKKQKGLVTNFSVECFKIELKKIIKKEITEREKRVNLFKSINNKLLLCALCGYFLHYHIRK